MSVKKPTKNPATKAPAKKAAKPEVVKVTNLYAKVRTVSDLLDFVKKHKLDPAKTSIGWSYLASCELDYSVKLKHIHVNSPCREPITERPTKKAKP